MRLAKHLIPGVDIWLNTPTRPLEASGTSGQKAIMNGVINFSVLDGWWYEGYQENAGWKLTDKRTYTNQEYQDELDAVTIYNTFEKKILPLYYAKNTKGYSPEWMQYVKNTIGEVAPRFTMKRMIDDYIEKFYKKLAKRHSLLMANDYAKAKDLAAKKEDTAAKWDSISVVSATFLDSEHPSATGGQVSLTVGETVRAEAIIDKGEIKGDLGLDCIFTQYDPETKTNKFNSVLEFKLVKEEGSKLHFVLSSTADKAGTFNYGFRIYPKHEDMPHRMDFAYVHWI